MDKDRFLSLREARMPLFFIGKTSIDLFLADRVAGQLYYSHDKKRCITLLNKQYITRVTLSQHRTF